MHISNDFEKSISLVKNVCGLLKSQKSDSKRIGNLLKVPSTNPYLIIGDIHGDLDGMKKLFSQIDIKEYLEQKSNMIIFLGDYIDRGPAQLETLELILNLFQSKPKQILLVRGNHEGPSDLPCFPNDFRRIIHAKFPKFSKKYLENLQTLFDYLLSGVIIENKALLVHGGLPTHGEGLGDIAYAHKLHPSRPHLEEILWNDPMPEMGVKKSPRGAGYLFGPDITENYLKTLKVKSMIRGHQFDPKGFKLDHNQILTIFSSKNRNYSNAHRTALLVGKNHSFKLIDLVKDLIFF